MSRVMNEPDRVSDEVRQRVLGAAKELNYAPSRAARSLRSGRTGVIALLVGDISQPFNAALSQGAALAAEAKGMSVVLADLMHSDDRFVQLLQRVTQQGVDGIIVATADDLDGPAVVEALERVHAGGTPLVISGQTLEALPVPTLPIDYRHRAVIAVEHLRAIDRSRVALGVANLASNAGRNLASGFNDTIDASRSAGVFEIGRTFEAARAATLLQLAGGTVDALIVPTVLLALGALRAVQELGLEPGVDISIVCCEHVELAGETTPTITTVGEEPRAIGTVTVSALDDLINGRDAELPALTQRLTVRHTSTATA